MVTLFGKTRTYTADSRQVGAAIEPFMRDPSEHGYRLTVYNDLDKTVCAQTLVRQFDFGPFRRLGDIGGVPFLQARVILDHHPHLGATLTDYDGGSVAVLEKMGIFASDQPRLFAQLDLEKGDLSVIDGCDILTMWAVDYALSDAALINLFRHVARSGASLLLAAIHASPARVAIQNFKSLIYRTVGEARMRRRFHGWLRSDAYLDGLAARAGCRTRACLRVGRYSVHVITAA
jgi:hypothetical protein